MAISFKRNRLRRVSQPATPVRVTGQTVSSGDVHIDQRLPGGGWPLASLTELYADRCGESDLHLLVPTIQRVLRYSHRRIALIGPPRMSTAATPARLGMERSRFWTAQPANPAEACSLACEALESGAFGVVMLWETRLVEHQLRRLDRAADDGHCLAFLCREQPVPKHDFPNNRLQVGVTLKPETGELYLRCSSHVAALMGTRQIRSGARAA